MNDSDNNEDVDDWFDLSLTTEELNNKRSAVRYVRSDIIIRIRTLGFFNFSKYLPVKLVDISSKGASFECKQKLSIKTKIKLKLIFKDKTKFIIPARIVYKNNKQYGLRFDKFSNELGDYLLNSQNDLIFH